MNLFKVFKKNGESGDLASPRICVGWTIAARHSIRLIFFSNERNQTGTHILIFFVFPFIRVYTICPSHHGYGTICMQFMNVLLDQITANVPFCIVFECRKHSVLVADELSTRRIDDKWQMGAADPAK